MFQNRLLYSNSKLCCQRELPLSFDYPIVTKLAFLSKKLPPQSKNLSIMIPAPVG